MIRKERKVHLLFMIEVYLRQSGVPASRFGREVLGDPGFVRGLRCGREPRAQTVRRVVDYLAEVRDVAGGKQ